MIKDNCKINKEECNSALTTTNTTYARICVILLALNFCVTGYVLTGVLKLQQEATGQASTAPTEVVRPVTPSVSTVIPVSVPEIKTLEKK